MNWEISERSECFVAKGINGAFMIWKGGKYFYARYIGKNHEAFNFPRQNTLEKMKEMCEMNDYWEK